jgi:hypothetical protein
VPSAPVAAGCISSAAAAPRGPHNKLQAALQSLPWLNPGSSATAFDDASAAADALRGSAAADVSAAAAAAAPKDGKQEYTSPDAALDNEWEMLAKDGWLKPNPQGPRNHGRRRGHGRYDGPSPEAHTTEETPFFHGAHQHYPAAPSPGVLGPVGPPGPPGECTSLQGVGGLLGACWGCGQMYLGFRGTRGFRVAWGTPALPSCSLPWRTGPCGTPRPPR